MSKKRYKYHPDDEPYAPFHYYNDLMKEAERLGYKSYKSSIIALHGKNKSIREIAREFCVSFQAIHMAMKKFGLRSAVTSKGKFRAHTFKKECKKHGITDHYESCGVCRQCQFEANDRYGMLKKMGEPINGPGGNNRKAINVEWLRCNEK